MDNLRQKKRSFGSDAKNHKVIWNHMDAVQTNASVADASTRLLVHEALYSLYEGVTCNDVAATGQWDCMPIVCPQGVRRSFVDYGSWAFSRHFCIRARSRNCFLESSRTCLRNTSRSMTPLRSASPK